MREGSTLGQHLRGESVPESLIRLLEAVATAGKQIAHAVGEGELGDALGVAGSENVQGETQKQLDLISNEIFIDCMQRCGVCAGLASEEMDDIYPLVGDGEYLAVFDPLDGSSNIDVNVTTGSIFSVLRSPGANPDTAAYLQPGSAQVAAGYVAYGPATVMVLSTGDGVHSYTLDRSVGEFFHARSGLSIPERTGEYAFNTANHRHWEAPMRAYVDGLVAGAEGPRGRDFNMRYVGSMVADVHRILTRGGLFSYPADAKMQAKGQPGKLRLLYEANPIGLLVEQAGGLASTGRERILDIQPTALHQRVPVALGAREEILEMESHHR